MINTYQYGGHKTVTKKDGKKINIPLPNNLALHIRGPLIQVVITHPKKIAEKISQTGTTIPTATIMALIDTGASSSVITDKIANDLGLIQTGFQKVTSVQDQQDRPQYFVNIRFPWGSGKEVPVASCPLKGIDCLIGRDILMHWNMVYNGKDGLIIICD